MRVELPSGRGKGPPSTPPGKAQRNFTDPQSRIMKAGNGNHFEQSYNAQAAVEVESRLIVGELAEVPLRAKCRSMLLTAVAPLFLFAGRKAALI